MCVECVCVWNVRFVFCVVACCAVSLCVGVGAGVVVFWCCVGVLPVHTETS